METKWKRNGNEMEMKWKWNKNMDKNLEIIDLEVHISELKNLFFLQFIQIIFLKKLFKTCSTK